MAEARLLGPKQKPASDTESPGNSLPADPSLVPQAGTDKKSHGRAPRPPTEGLAQRWAPHQHPLVESSRWEGLVLMTPFYNGKRRCGSESQSHLPEATQVAKAKLAQGRTPAYKLLSVQS